MFCERGVDHCIDDPLSAISRQSLVRVYHLAFLIKALEQFGQLHGHSLLVCKDKPARRRTPVRQRRRKGRTRHPTHLIKPTLDLVSLRGSEIFGRETL